MERYADPFEHFDAWFEEARDAERLPEAAAMATVDAEGLPSNRMVLVRWRTGPGFDVYTDLESRKGDQLRATQAAAICWWWPVSQRQVRVEGRIEFLDDAAGDAYWESRPRATQLAALSSQQSHPIADRAELEARYREVEASNVPYLPIARPARWGGVRLLPDRLEFWQQEENRLHDRLEYLLDGGEWTARALQP
jgi:pyridoxamine 5'-phosphate oxidase